MKNTDVNQQAHRGSWQALRMGFDSAIARLPQALQAEGFGVITQIDLQQTFKAKLGVEFRRYRIFGACNPAYALEAVKHDPRAGLLLPCNIVIFEQDDGVAMLGIIDPMHQLNSSNGALTQLAQEIGARLTRVAKSLESAGGFG